MRKSIIEFLNNTKKPALFKAKSTIYDDLIQNRVLIFYFSKFERFIDILSRSVESNGS